MVVKPLFFREDQLGFIIFELNQKKEVNTYETLRLQISSALKGSLLFRDRKKAEEKLFEALKNLEESNIKLQNLSQKDELTSLYNRRGFLTMATQNINLAARMRKNGLLFYADLDGLKRINDTYGHTEGDIAIIKTAKILKKTFRDADILARLGGDEFVILAIDTPIGFMENLRKRLDKNLESYNNGSGKLYKISISMGAAPFNHSDTRTIEELMNEADHVLYDQKKERKAKQAR
jgi:diguanylate cyclase (GGDEF)-like protein